MSKLILLNQKKKPFSETKRCAASAINKKYFITSLVEVFVTLFLTFKTNFYQSLSMCCLLCSEISEQGEEN